MNVVNIRPMLVTAGKPPRNYADFAIEVKYYRQRGVAIFDGEAVTCCPSLWMRMSASLAVMMGGL